MSFVHRNVLFLIVLATTTIFYSTPAPPDSFEEYKTYHVHCVNDMSNNKILFVHCKSRDNDLGPHNLTAGSEIQWKFRPDVIGKTLFWCFMAADIRHAAFNVFWDDENLYYRCNWKNCIWIGKDDGIYLRNIPENFDEFRVKWEPNSID